MFRQMMMSSGVRLQWLQSEHRRVFGAPAAARPPWNRFMEWGDNLRWLVHVSL